jgi:hypothetical protein
MTSVTKTARAVVVSGVTGLLGLALAFGPSEARADEKSPTIQEKVPPKPKPAPAQAKTAVVDEKAPFDLSGLPPLDRETEKAIGALDEACVASPMSREGMSPKEEARCNLAMARVVARGKVGASAILAALNDHDAVHTYYARAQLYSALGKVDDPKVRGVVIAGLEKIGKEHLEEFVSDTYEMQAALFAMFGAGPEAIAPWDAAVPVSDGWEEAKLAAAEWRKVEATWAGKKRNEVLITRLTSAKKEKASDDPKVAYRAIAYLVKQAPREAKTAATLYSKRKDLKEDIAAAFEDLSSEAEFRVTMPNARL